RGRTEWLAASYRLPLVCAVRAGALQLLPRASVVRVQLQRLLADLSGAFALPEFVVDGGEACVRLVISVVCLDRRAEAFASLPEVSYLEVNVAETCIERSLVERRLRCPTCGLFEALAGEF